MTDKEQIPGFFVQDGISDGYVVRLEDLTEKHFPTATKIEEKGTTEELNSGSTEFIFAALRQVNTWNIGRSTVRGH